MIPVLDRAATLIVFAFLAVARCAMDANKLAVDSSWRNHEAQPLAEDGITPAMMPAGVVALAEWDYNDEEPEAAIAAIWYSMCEAKRNPTLPE